MYSHVQYMIDEEQRKKDKQYAADCIEFLRELADYLRNSSGGTKAHEDKADRLEEIATSLQIDTQEEG